MSEYNGKLLEGMYKMDLETTRRTPLQPEQPMGSPCPLDETSMPTFPGIESWLHLVDSSDSQELPREIAGSDISYAGVHSSEHDEDDEGLQSPSPSSSPKLSAATESESARAQLTPRPNSDHRTGVQHHAAAGSFTAASSRSSACTSLDCDIRDDEAVSNQWEKKGQIQTLEQAECDCLQLTASLLGDLGGINARSHATSLDVLLQFAREAVSKCRGALDCAQCVSTRPANALLLCMASKYISTLYERISLSYNMMERTAKFEDQYEYEGDEEEEEDDLDVDDEEWEARKVENWTEERLYEWFAAQGKQNPQKRLQVIRRILTSQLSRFTDLVTSLKGESLQGDCCAPFLTEAEGRMGRLSTQMAQTAASPVW